MSGNVVDILKTNSRDDLVEKIKNAGFSANSDADLYCFFADPADHSLSPYIYNNAFSISKMNSVYFPSRIPQGMIRDAINKVRDYGIKGVNISMPHKDEVMNYIDDFDETARLSMAVNTIVNNAGSLKGYNTDSIGAMKALKNIGCEIKGENAVLFGLGGAGKAILAGFINAGANDISIFVREPERIDFTEFVGELRDRCNGASFKLYDLNDNTQLWQKIQDSTILVNSTSVGMGDTEGQSFLYDETFLHNKLAVMDIIYEPKETRLLELAKLAKCKKAINGLGMLWFQAEAAFKLYTGRDIPKEARDMLEI